MTRQSSNTVSSGVHAEDINQPQRFQADVKLEEIWTVAITAQYRTMRPRQVWEPPRRRSQQRSKHPLPFAKVHLKCSRLASVMYSNGLTLSLSEQRGDEETGGNEVRGSLTHPPF